MADPTLEELLRAYGHGYEPAGPSGDRNSTEDLLRGPAPPITTADYTRVMGDQQRAKEQAPYHSISNILATLATLGAGIGPSLARRATPRPSSAEWAAPQIAERPYEWPVQPAKAIKVGDAEHVFTGSSHMDAVRQAQAALGDALFEQGHAVPMPTKEFITNAGRRVTAEEAGRLLDERNQTNHYTSHWLTGRPKKDGLYSEALELYDLKTGKELYADPRANAAGRALVEQSGKPTAGTTPLSPRQAALEQGREAFHATGPTSTEAARLEYDSPYRAFPEVGNSHPMSGFRSWDPMYQAVKEWQAAQPPPKNRLNADPRASAVAVGAAEQAAKPRYALSENLRPGPSPNDARGRPGFLHHIYSNDQKIGSASGHIDGDKAFLSWIGASGQKNKLGPEGLSQLREEFRKLYPDVKTFEGFRSSGSRNGPATRPDASQKQSVTLPAVTGLPLAQEHDDRDWLAQHYPQP